MTQTSVADPRDATHVRSPWDWSMFPIQPLRHRLLKDETGLWPVHGCLVAGEGPVVRLCTSVFLVSDFMALEKITYSSWEELLESWAVD